MMLSYYLYGLINRARGLDEEIFVLTLKAYGPNTLRSMRLDCQNKYFPYGPKSRLIRALLYTYPCRSVGALFTVLVRCPVHTPVRTPMYGLPLSQSDKRIRSVFQSVNNKCPYYVLFHFTFLTCHYDVNKVTLLIHCLVLFLRYIAMSGYYAAALSYCVVILF